MEYVVYNSHLYYVLETKNDGTTALGYNDCIVPSGIAFTQNDYDNIINSRAVVKKWTENYNNVSVANETIFRDTFVMGKDSKGVVNTANVLLTMERKNTSHADRFTIYSTALNNNTSQSNIASGQMAYIFTTADCYAVRYAVLQSNGKIKCVGITVVVKYHFSDQPSIWDNMTGSTICIASSYYYDNTSGIPISTNNERITPIFENARIVDNDDNSVDNSEGGGYGSNDNPKTTITIPNLPNFNLNASGSSLYLLTVEQMYQFTKYLWTSDWTTNIKHIRNDPMENIINIGLIDVNVGGDTTTIVLGNVVTDCYGALIPRFIEVDCGSITLSEYYGTFADYEPYTKVSLYLPKIGVISIPCDIVMNNTLSIKYHIELSSGEGICYLYVYNNREDFGYIYNTYSCSCVASVPLSASNHSQLIQSQVSAVASLGGAVVSGNPLAVTGSALSGAWNVASTKVPTETRGSMGNMSSLMCHKKPYLMINATYLCKPTDFKKNNGHNSYITASIGNLTGYCKTKSYHADFEAPMDCLLEIESILNSGFYI